MFGPDLGELAYGSGDAVVLSNDVALVGPDGDAAGLPMSCAPEAWLRIYTVTQHMKIWYFNFKKQELEVEIS
ncbi:hypothetical protein Pint_30560 [Pistacia integerrima]|uniref:Uncharacterized protein n=1 Tax=Pistacia integerrima TaxID=434235 RepID=A0ACC0X1D2_9ROSI|nr:hypothetical protein Pint_30560 [Pistacia integerrima]